MMKRTYPESVKPFKAVYAVEENAIVSHNGTRFFNRPLYAPNIPAMALAGDKPQMQLGNNRRAMVLNLVMRSGIVLESVELETLSQEVVVGLMGLTIMN